MWEYGEVVLGYLDTSETIPSQFAFSFPSENYESRQIFYCDLENLELKTEFLTSSGEDLQRCAAGRFVPFPSGLSRYSANLGKIRRLLIYLTALRECGELTNPFFGTLERIRECLRAGWNGKNVNTWEFRAVAAGFAALYVLSEGQLLCDSPYFKGFLREMHDANKFMLPLDLGADEFRMDDELFQTLKFVPETSGVPDVHSPISYQPATLADRDILEGVLRRANDASGGVAFSEEDYQTFDKELKFSLRPDVCPAPLTEGEQFSRIDFWAARENTWAAGVIGLAVFTPNRGVWITWFGVIPNINLGARLTALVCEIAANRGFRELYVWTTAVNKGACDVYHRWGFVTTEETPPDAHGIEYRAFRRTLESSRCYSHQIASPHALSEYPLSFD
jgi:hypothetical protein